MMPDNNPNANQSNNPSAPGPNNPNGTSGSAPAPNKNQDDQKLRGISRSLLIAVGGTGHKILLDVRQRLIAKVRHTG